MNYLELQQRANILVQKVNEYESSLTGQTWDENQILNQHQYADIYCLRPVLKMLFGKTIDEKLNRTLDNDIDLRAFCSTSPMWNSSFSLLSFSKGVQNITTPGSSSRNVNDLGLYGTPESLTWNPIGSFNFTDVTVNDEDAAILFFHTGSDITSTQACFTSQGTATEYLVIGNGYFQTKNNKTLYAVQPDTDYYVKFKKNSSNSYWTVQISEDGINYSDPYVCSMSIAYLYGWYGRTNNLSIAPNDFKGTLSFSKSSYQSKPFYDTEFKYLNLPLDTSSSNTADSIRYGVFTWNSLNNVQFLCSGSYTTQFPNLLFDIPEGLFSGSEDYIEISFKTTFRLQPTSTSYTKKFGFGLGYTDVSGYSSSSNVVYLGERNNTMYLSNLQDLQKIFPDAVSVGDEVEIKIKLLNNKRPTKIEYTISNLTTGSTATQVYEVSLISSSYTVEYIRLTIPSNNISPSNFGGFYDFKVNYYQTAYSVGYEASQHPFVNDINMYNNYNMITQDVYINTEMDRDERIPAGLNYSYSSNIQDALVTESQVANMFRWNTTNSETIVNNTMSVNRQVPGIVTYYLGTDYDSTYTATIPYSARVDNINSVNYSTPPYYGAYYTQDISTSQVGLSMGAEACRIFMPGLNYTRGYLESPQQIWQPDRRVGSDNTGLGYNWQGGAVYHELVFKRRRQGAEDANVDFIPSVLTDEDNDPQGLAMRTAIAQQKPYYYNRPWFNELDELYGANMEKLAEAIGSVQQSYESCELNEDLLEATTDNLTFSDDGNVSGFTSTDYINFIDPTTYSSNTVGTTYIIEFTTGSDITSTQKIFAGDSYLRIGINSSQFYLYDAGFVNLFNVTANTKYRVRITWTTTAGITIDQYNFNTESYSQVSSRSIKEAPTNKTTLRIGTGELNFTTQIFNGSVNLINSSVQLPNQDLITFGELVTKFKTAESDEDYFKNVKLDYNTWAQALDKPL